MPGEAVGKGATVPTEGFIMDLKKGKEMGSIEVVKRTIDVLRRTISHTKWTTAQELLNLVRDEGRKIIKADPTEVCIANIVRRILKIVREEYVSFGEEGKKDGSAAGDNDDNLLAKIAACDFNVPCQHLNLKAPINETIGELITEVDTCAENIASQALEYIHSDETILTFGHSKTVEAFLKNAARKRKFHVIVSEAEPFFQGHTLAKNLTDLGVEVTLMPDTHVFGMMRKVNKVFIGIHSIMAEGGCKGPCGLWNVAHAAKVHKVPLFVCAANYKLSPDQFMNEIQPGFQKWTDPTLFLPMDDDLGDVDTPVSNAVFEYVGPELIKLFIFNTGPIAPSTVYRLVSETYHQEDLKLLEDDDDDDSDQDSSGQ